MPVHLVVAINKIKSSKNNTPDHKKLFKKPPLLASKSFSLWVQNNNCDYARFGVTVPKKNVKLAVNRNKAKRLAKEIFRTVKQNFIKKDIILVVRKFENNIIHVWKKQLLDLYLWLEHYC